MSDHFIKLVDLMPINELNDMGDRMILGYPMNQGGAIGGMATQLNHFTTDQILDEPEIVQDPKKLGTMINNTNLIKRDRGENVINVTPLSTTDKAVKQYKDTVDKIQYKVTPDEVICGLDYELNKMVMKDTNLAKIIVVNNLKIDPQYYSKLHMLGVYPGEKEDIPSDPEKQISDTDMRRVPTIWEVVDYYRKGKYNEQ